MNRIAVWFKRLADMRSARRQRAVEKAIGARSEPPAPQADTRFSRGARP